MTNNGKSRTQVVALMSGLMLGMLAVLGVIMLSATAASASIPSQGQDSIAPLKGTPGTPPPHGTPRATRTPCDTCTPLPTRPPRETPPPPGTPRATRTPCDTCT